MQLPNSKNAYIEPSKLSGYLISETHKDGKSKAKFFRALGFDETNLKLLEDALLSIAKHQPVSKIVDSPHGVKYVIVGSIKTPSGKTATILTVWIIQAEQSHPRFVTARPHKPKR